MKLTNRKVEPGRVHATLWWRAPYDGPSLSVDLGWTRAGSRHVAAELEVGGDERDLCLHVGLWWLSLYVVLAGLIPHAWRRASHEWAQRRADAIGGYAYELDPLGGRTTGVRAFDGSIWLDLWRDPDGWRAEDTPSIRRRRGRWELIRGHWPWNGLGWSWTLRVADWLLGRERHEVDASWTRTVPTTVRMPEGDYAAVATTERVRWGRRWWWSWSRWQYRTTIEVPGGLPVPGKGENAWDCDDDATYAHSFAAEPEPPFSEREHADRYALDVLRTRQRRAWIGWSPEGGWPAHRATA